MPRNPDIPRAERQLLYRPGSNGHTIKIGSPAWFDWLEAAETRSFAFKGDSGRFTARKESKKRGNEYWYAYRWINGKTTKAYLGTSDNLTPEKLNEVASRLSQQQLTLPFS